MQKIRLLSQVFFASLCGLIGIEFALWLKTMESANWGQSSMQGLKVMRPPGVEAFLPISSLMNLRHWIQWGEIQMFHPAGVFIFLGIVSGSFFLGKFFCSWMCPIGFVSEIVWNVRSRIFGARSFSGLYWVDVFFRSLKYFLLAFFTFAIFALMDAQAIHDFLESPYNVAADAKMYDFFAGMSVLSAVVISFLILVSLFVRNAWCRFLCPYGALLGLIGLVSLVKIRRSSLHCINCEKCKNVCPAGISVHKIQTVISDECSSCLKCLSVCPAKGALETTLVGLPGKRLSWKFLPIFALAIFAAFILWGVGTSRWKNVVDPSFYREVIQNRKALGHPGQAAKFSR